MEEHKTVPQSYQFPMHYQSEDEIDLISLFASIFAQWRVIVGVTLVGTMLVVLYVSFLPSQYDMVVKVAPPSTADIQVINIRGYDKLTANQIFSKYFNHIRSAEVFKQYLKEKGWYKKLHKDESLLRDEDRLFSGLYRQLKLQVERDRNVGKEFKNLIPELVNLTFSWSDEAVGVQLINGFVEYTNSYLVNELALKGKASVILEQEKLQKQIDELRADAKVRRDLLIRKISEQNKEKIETLKDEKNLLLAKAKSDKESKIAVLEEAYDIAKKVGIKKLTTIEAIATEDKSTKTMVSLSNTGNKIHALMGTIYLKSELEMLRNRQNDVLFIPKISQLEKEIEDLKYDEKLTALKERKSDDPYIEQLPDLIKRMEYLKNISFDFSGVQLYRLDQKAFADGQPEKPKRLLIVMVGFFLSGFISLFVVLVINGVSKYKETEAKPVS